MKIGSKAADAAYERQRDREADRHMSDAVYSNHRPDCSCSECWHKRIQTSRAAFREWQKGQDPFERERGIRRAEAEYEARIYRDRG